MVLEGDGYAVVSVTMAGPAPFSVATLDLEPGLTAVYGVNGSGKSRLISALSQALRLAHSDHAKYEVLFRGPVPGTVLGDLLDTPGFTGCIGQWFDLARGRWRRDYNIPLQGDDATLADIAGAAYANTVADVTQMLRSFTTTSGPVQLPDIPPWEWSGDVAVVGSGEHVMAVVRRPSDERGERVIAPGPLRPPLADVVDGAGACEPVAVINLDEPGDPDRLVIDYLNTMIPDEGDFSSTAAYLQAAEEVEEAARGLVTDLEDRASRVVQTLLPGAGALTFDLGDHRRRLTFGPVGWRMRDVSGSLVPLEYVSRAQRRWASAAIHLAVRASDVPAVLIADEPEAGLHRSIEAALPRALEELRDQLDLLDYDVQFIVATHSPAFLNHPTTRLVHVQRDAAGRAVLSASTGPTLGGGITGTWDAQTFGLRRADLLSLARIIIVVEGEHDRAVLETLLRDELHMAAAVVVPAHGARNLPAVSDARILLDFSDAAILLVTDNIDPNTVTEPWELAKQQAVSGEDTSARVTLTMLGSRGERSSWELEWLVQAGEHALERGLLHRLSVHPLPAPDVLWYLDPTLFGLEASWDALWEEYQQSRTLRDVQSGAKTRRVDFKSWLSSTKRARINVEVIREAASLVLSLPPDVAALGQVVLRLASAP